MAYVGITRAEKSFSSRARACARSLAAPPLTRHRDSFRRFRRNSWRMSDGRLCRRGFSELAAPARGAAAAAPPLRAAVPPAVVRLGHAVLLRTAKCWRGCAKPCGASKPAAFRAPQPAAGGAVPDYKASDKVSHGKWGVGTVVSVKGSGDDTELQIASPGACWPEAPACEVRSYYESVGASRIYPQLVEEEPVMSDHRGNENPHSRNQSSITIIIIRLINPRFPMPVGCALSIN